MKNLNWMLIVIGCAGILISLRIGREINYFTASDSKRYVALALFFGGAALAIIGATLLK